jgi:hypothetical protein
MPHMVDLAGGRGLVTPPGPLAAPLGPEDDRIADGRGDVLGIALVCLLYL